MFIVSPCDIVTAAFLLTAPLGTQDSIPPADQWPMVQRGLQQLAVQWEILDTRESGYILNRREEFVSDINLLRRRMVEFKDVPLLADHYRLPSKQIASDLISVNREYRKSLADRRVIEVDRAQILGDVIRECDELYQVWDCIRDANCDYYHVTVRRQSLKRLRDLVGDDDYNSAKFPASIPYWRMGR
jgi:hypothetical protein